MAERAEEDLSSQDYAALGELRYRIRRFLHFSEEAARQEELEPQQHQLLLTIKGLPPGTRATIGELATRSAKPPPAVV